jgi:hypothetical protein
VEKSGKQSEREGKEQEDMKEKEELIMKRRENEKLK